MDGKNIFYKILKFICIINYNYIFKYYIKHAPLSEYQNLSCLSVGITPMYKNYSYLF